MTSTLRVVRRLSDRRWNQWGVIFAGFGAIAAGVGIWLALSSGPPSPTRTLVVTPTATAARTTAVCADRSATSIRADARTCVAVTLVFDPCFVTSPKVVVCPLDLNGKRETFTIARTVEMADTVKSIEATVPIEDAVASSYPWAIRPAHGSWCMLQYWRTGDRPDNPAGHTYICKRDYITEAMDPDALFTRGEAFEVTWKQSLTTVTAIYACSRRHVDRSHS